MQSRRVLLTGATGFVGAHLARLLLERGYSVFGLDRRSVAGLAAGVTPLACDLADPDSLSSLPREWDAVVHLAGISVPSLFTTVAPVAYNLQITLNLLDHLRAARVLLVSSCLVYAAGDGRRKEDDPIVPQGRYGLSKHLIEQLQPHYRKQLDVRIARPFNHLGPGMRPELVVPSLLRRLSAAPARDRSPVQMQGLNSTRDFIDVRDVAEAYLAILELEHPAHGTFNVCTGEGTTIEQVVHAVLRRLGADREVVFAGTPHSSDDNLVLVGDPTRLSSAGWTARFSLEQTLSTMLEQAKPEL